MFKGKLSHLIAAAYLSFAVGNTSMVYADDTEIYLNSASSAGTSNILFSLDTSGSMGTLVDENNNGTIDPGERPRIEVLKEAMLTVLDSLPPLNAGILRYHYYGGPILYPVANVDEFACVIEGNCSVTTGTTGIQTVTSVLTTGNNDVEQEGALTVTMDRVALDIGERPAGSCSTVSDSVRISSSSDDAESAVGSTGYSDTSSDLEITRDGGTQQVIGLRFQNVPIPAGVTVTDARIVFEIDSTSASGYNAPIDTITFDNGTGEEPEDRLANPTFASTNWETGEFPAVNENLTTDNISGILDELVNDPAWPATGGDDVVLLIFKDPGAASGSSGSRELESYNGESSAAPLLTFTYQICSASGPEEIRTGLRFTNVNIPQGSTITGARIDFINTTSEFSAPELQVKMQDADNAEAFAVGTPITGRTFHGSPVAWTAASAPALTNWDPVDSTYATPDLTTMVQDVVNRSGWCGGNNMMFMIERTGGANVLRTAYSFEGDSTKAPVLTITYDADAALPVGGGCQRSTIVSLVSAGNNDAEEHADGSIDTGSSDLEMVEEADTQVVGIRFSNIPIANGAVITSAKLVFTADEIHSGATSLTITGQLSDDANAFSNTAYDVTNTSNRPRTSASAPWSPAAFSSIGQLHEVTGLEGIIQEIVNRPGWAPDNALALFVSGTGKRVADSYDGDPATAPRLQITFEGTPVTTQATVRSRLKDIVSSLVQASGTPISGAMLESAYYFRGEPLVFGRQRGTQASGYRVSRVSHEASYVANGSTVTFPGACSADNINHDDCKTQVISGGTPRYKSPIIAECQTNFLVQLTDGGGYYTGDGLTNTLSQSIDEEDLINSLQAHDDSGNLVSLSSCASDTTLSDGTTFSSNSHNECTVQLAKFLHDNDQIYSSSQVLQSGTSPIDGVQTVDTYNIGFNLCGNGNVTGVSSAGEQVCCAAGTLVADAEGIVQECPTPLTDPIAIQVLKAQSDVGGGKYFNANTVDELVVAFTSITSDIIEKGATFVAPSIAVNTFNRLFSRDEVYFGLFETAKSARWNGNVKKYRICVDPDPDDDGTDDCSLGEVLDANGDPAVVDDPSSPEDDGQFELTAESLWSGGEDGRETKLGGAGGEITDYRDRLIYTEFEAVSGTAPAGAALSGSGYFFDETNWDDISVAAVRDEVCPDPSVLTAGSDCENRMLWLLGADTQDEDPLSDTRWWFHDVLHSSPVAVTYGQDASDNFIDKVLVGTNDGALHFINGSSGVEEWAFMPRAVLADQQGLYDNSGVDHIYGLDSTPVVGVHDVNLDGVIDPATDFIGVVISQRRGGDNIYALDLTPTATLTTVSSTVVPKFLWHINSSTAGFSRLGQSWSEPAIATIDTTSGPVSTVIFGGGYDTDLDLDDGSGLAKNFGLEAGSPNTGNAIYVVNATTGDLIFSIGGVSSGADIEISNMQYAIPSNITVIDADGDGFEDRMYVGDTAGQVFRVDLINVNPASATDPQGDTIVGVLADISTAGTLADERRFFYKPTVVQVVDTEFSNAAGGEYDYVIIGSGNRANPLDRAVSDRLYAFRDVTTGVMTDSDSNNIADNYPINTDTSALGTPIDNSVLIDISATVLDASDTSTDSALGWFFDFGNTASPRDGEKVLAASNVLAGTAIFTTYVPDSGAAVADPCQAAEGNGVVYNLDILSTRATRDWDGDGTVEDIADRSYELGRPGIPSEVVSVFTQEGVTLLSGTEDLPGFDLPRFNTYWYEENE
jgi:type IV pilus assembly protein PilY1